MGGDRRSTLEEQAGWIADRLAQSSGLTPGEVAEGTCRAGHRSQLRKRLADGSVAGLRHRKRTIFATEQNRSDVAIARDIWRGVGWARLPSPHVRRRVRYHDQHDPAARLGPQRQAAAEQGARARTARIPGCVRHNGYEEFTLCHEANSLRYRTSCWISCWLAAQSVLP